MQHEEDISHYLCVFYQNVHDNNWEVVASIKLKGKRNER